jgi:hypothetical protein
VTVSFSRRTLLLGVTYLLTYLLTYSYVGKVWTGFIWLRIGTSNEPLGSRKGEEFLD